MNTRLSIYGSPAETASALADDVVSTLAATLDEKEAAHLVLTGGTMGIRALAAVAEHPASSALDWGRVHIWWGDERWVPADSDDRNDKQAAAALLDAIPLDPDKVHRMPSADAGADLDDAALAYGRELYTESGTAGSAPEFDVLLLGIGPDGHIASLFPGRAQVYDKAQGAVPVYDSPKLPPERISLTLPTINRARRVWFVAAGTDKATAVHMAFRGLWFVDLPASGAKGSLETRWFVDEAAASELDDDIREEFSEDA